MPSFIQRSSVWLFSSSSSLPFFLFWGNLSIRVFLYRPLTTVITYINSLIRLFTLNTNKGVLCQALFPQKSNLTIEKQKEKHGVTGGGVQFERNTVVSYQICLLDCFCEGSHQLLNQTCVSSLALGAVVSRWAPTNRGFTVHYKIMRESVGWLWSETSKQWLPSAYLAGFRSRPLSPWSYQRTSAC